MKAQCPCVKGPEKTPDPNCIKCGGGGFLVVSFPDEDDVEAVFVGRCPLCGSSNGCHIQRKGKPAPKGDLYWKCVNQDCQRVPVEMINSQLVISWGAVCPICFSVHFSDFLQRACDDSPTFETHPRICPRLDCGAEMMWVLGSQIIDNSSPD